MKGKELKTILLRRGFKLNKVAELSGITPQALDSKLRAASIKTDFLEKIAKAINTTSTQLLKEVDIFITQGLYQDETVRELAKNALDKPVVPDRNARMLGNPVDIHTTKGGTRFIELSEGQFVMFPHIVTIRARAGFVGGGYGDPEYIDSLPTQAVIVDQVHQGHYLWFVIDGDSMNDGSIEKAIPDGTKVLGREIKMDLWRSRFHYNEYTSFVIVHKTDGILCKEIVAHDIERGIITCRSLNPNKVMYPDFELRLDECAQIYNVVRRDVA